MTKTIIIVSFMLFVIPGLFCQSSQDLQVKFSDMDSNQYVAFKKDYHRELIVDSSKISRYDSSFSLMVGNKEQVFEGDLQLDESYKYEGFLPPLNSYVLTKCNSWSCGTVLVNRTTGNRQPIMTPYEAPCNTQILLSKDKNKILVITSDAFATETYISTYQRGNETGHFDFTNFKSLTCDKWKVDEAVWIDDKTFALLTYDDVACRMKSSPVAYIKGEIK